MSAASATTAPSGCSAEASSSSVVVPDGGVLRPLLSNTRQILLAEFERSRLLSAHASRIRESVCRELFLSALPRSLDIVSGVIWDASGNQSGELDNIIVDSKHPLIRLVPGAPRGSGNIALYHSVFAVVEVEARFADSTVKDMQKKFALLDALQLRNATGGTDDKDIKGMGRPLRVIVALRNSIAAGDMEDKMIEMQADAFYDLTGDWMIFRDEAETLNLRALDQSLRDFVSRRARNASARPPHGGQGDPSAQPPLEPVVRTFSMFPPSSALPWLCHCLAKLATDFDNKPFSFGSLMPYYIGQGAAVHHLHNGRMPDRFLSTPPTRDQRDSTIVRQDTELKALRDFQSRILPQDIFKGRTGEFGTFDERGIPLTTIEGETISESARGALIREHEDHAKNHRGWLSRQNSGGSPAGASVAGPKS